MKIFYLIIFAFLIFNPIFSYSTSNLKFNKIEDKINYLNKRIGFLYFESTKVEQLLFKTEALITKKEKFTCELIQRIELVSTCANEIKINSAEFRLQRWLYIFLKKLKSQKRHIIKDIIRMDNEIFKSNLNNEVLSLKNCENLNKIYSDFLGNSINQLTCKIKTFNDYYFDIKEKQEILISKITKIEENILKEKKELNNSCCWI